MAETQTAIERLEGLLNERDAEIERMREEVQAAERTVAQSEAGWSLPVRFPDEQTLPVPRLQMTFETDDDRWYEWTVSYRLVHRHFLGHVIGVALGSTTVRGGNGGPPIRDGKLDLPFRDGVHMGHDARSLGLRAFAVCGDHVEEIPTEPAVVASASP